MDTKLDNKYSEVQRAIEFWRETPKLSRLDDPNLLNGSKQLPGGSGWTHKHSNAFHVVHILNICVKDVIQLEYCPEDVLHNIRAFLSLLNDWATLTANL